MKKGKENRQYQHDQGAYDIKINKGMQIEINRSQ